MENLTNGMINQKFVNKFYKALIKFDGDIYSAALYANEKFNLNAAGVTNEQDSWHEALARYRLNLGE